jgi:hypothetical protein
MKRVATLVAVLLAAQTLPAAARAEAEYEPCYVFEVEESVAFKGQAPQSRKETCFTAAELPWAPLEIVPRTQLEGFVATQETVELEFQGKKIQATKITWKRDPKQRSSNISAAAVRFWVSREVPTPSFPVNLGPGPQLRLPAGCAKLEVVPHDKDSAGIDKREIERSVAASGEYKRAATYKLGDKSLPAHEFAYTVPTAPQKGTWTVTLSLDMPGGVCAMQLDGEPSGGLRVVAMITAPLPKGLEAFPKEGFAFAPPAGYAKSKEPKPGEVVRYVKGAKTFLSVSTVELDKDGLEGLRLRLSAPAKTPESGMRVFSISRAHHIAGHPSFDAYDRESKVLSIFTEHAGRGYRIDSSELEGMKPDEASELLRGWRWLRADRDRK